MTWLIPQFGFSYIGTIFLLLLFIPNIVWSKNQPEDYTPNEENKVLQMMERAGQVLVTSMSLCFSNWNLRPWSLWSWWLIAAAIFMMMYEGFWLRYFRGRHTMEDFYSSFCGVPVAGATLPVAAFFCLGLYGKSLWLLLAVVILGIGHIGVHLGHKRDLAPGKSKENNA